MTDAAVQLSMECVDGNDGLLMSVKNLPCPPVGVGLWRAKMSLKASFTAALSKRASPESRPVSLSLESPCQLPQTYIKPGTATSAAVGNILAHADGARVGALPRQAVGVAADIRTPAVPSREATHTESRRCRRKGLVQISFWSPGKSVKTFLKVTVSSAGAF